MRDSSAASSRAWVSSASRAASRCARQFGHAAVEVAQLPPDALVLGGEGIQLALQLVEPAGSLLRLLLAALARLSGGFQPLPEKCLLLPDLADLALAASDLRGEVVDLAPILRLAGLGILRVRLRLGEPLASGPQLSSQRLHCLGDRCLLALDLRALLLKPAMGIEHVGAAAIERSHALLHELALVARLPQPLLIRLGA